ncbi:DUF948 domain-containing protein [Oceanobacillus sp. CAU 1775]
MTWVGIGLIIIGIALLGLVGILIKPLMKATAVLSDIKKTTKDLPEKVDGITTQVNVALDTGVDTIQQINAQLKELTPIFYLVGDVGRTTHQLSSRMVTVVEDFERTEPESFASRRNLEGLYGAFTLGTMIFQKAKEFNQERKVVGNQ